MALNYLYKMTSTKIKELQPKCNLAFIPLGPTDAWSASAIDDRFSQRIGIVRKSSKKAAGRGD
ncbi:MAG: hypothetical protein ACLS2X_02335 [Coprococcus sp.]